MTTIIQYVSGFKWVHLVQLCQTLLKNLLSSHHDSALKPSVTPYFLQMWTTSLSLTFAFPLKHISNPHLPFSHVDFPGSSE